MWEIDKVDNYSELIEPSFYHKIMRNHLYIKETDQKIYELILEKARLSSKRLNICEIGGGSGALTELIVEIENIDLIIVEIDISFYKLLKEKFNKNDNVTILNKDISQYDFDNPVDIFYSMGVHHHIAKGKLTFEYLSKIKNNLAEEGIYILGDEFIPAYKNDKERTLNLIIWFSHIIENARLQGHQFLAIEEARTLYYDILGIEDYKNSLEDLEKELSDSELIIEDIHKEGPKENIGGLYIITTKKSYEK